MRQRRLPYRSRRHLLSPGERRFFLNGLQPAMGQRFLISFKVRLADVIATEDWASSHGRKISQKHVDFVLITPRTTRIAAVVELNDSTHIAEDRQKRDAFLAMALAAAEIPLITLPIYRRYEPRIIRQRILAAMEKQEGTSET